MPVHASCLLLHQRLQQWSSSWQPPVPGPRTGWSTPPPRRSSSSCLSHSLTGKTHNPHWQTPGLYWAIQPVLCRGGKQGEIFCTGVCTSKARQIFSKISIISKYRYRYQLILQIYQYIYYFCVDIVIRIARICPIQWILGSHNRYFSVHLYLFISIWAWYFS